MSVEWIEIGPCRIACGDCESILPSVNRADLLLTDPPYGIGVDGQSISTSKHGGRKPYEFLGWDSERPSRELFRLIIDRAEHAIIWGGNYFVQYLPPSMGWLVWDKGQDICSSDCELAFTTYPKALRRIVMNRVELQRDGAVHPTQKPVRLMMWCLEYACNSVTVLDPFMGSGTTGVACIRTGRKFIGIEKEEKYFQIAAKRLRQAWVEKQSELPFEPEPQMVQRSLLTDTCGDHTQGASHA